MLKKGYSLTETLVSLVIVGTVMAGALPVISVRVALNEETINGIEREKTWKRTANRSGIYYNEGKVGVNVDKDYISETGDGAPKYRLTIGSPGTNNIINFLNPGVTSTKPIPGNGVRNIIGSFSVESPSGVPTTPTYTGMKFYDENYTSTNGYNDSGWTSVDGSEDDQNFNRANELGIPYEGTIQYYRYRIKQKITIPPTTPGGEPNVTWSNWSSWQNGAGDVCTTTYSDSNSYQCQSYYVFSAPRTKGNYIIKGKNNSTSYASYSTIVGGQYNDINYSKFSVIYNSIGNLIEDCLQSVMINNNQKAGISIPTSVPDDFENCKMKYADNSVITSSVNSSIEGSESDHVENSVIMTGNNAVIQSDNNVMINSSGTITGENNVLLNASVSTLEANDCFIGGSNTISSSADRSIASGSSNTITQPEAIAIGDSNTSDDTGGITVGKSNITYDTDGIKIGENLQDSENIEVGFNEFRWLKVYDQKENRYIKNDNNPDNPPELDERRRYRKVGSSYIPDVNGDYVGLDEDLNSASLIDLFNYSSSSLQAGHMPARTFVKINDKGTYSSSHKYKKTTSSWNYDYKDENGTKYDKTSSGDYLINATGDSYYDYDPYSTKYSCKPYSATSSSSYNYRYLKCKSNASYSYYSTVSTSSIYIKESGSDSSSFIGLGNYISKDGSHYSRVYDILRKSYIDNGSNITQADINYLDSDSDDIWDWYDRSSSSPIKYLAHTGYIYDPVNSYNRYNWVDSLAKFHYHSYYGLYYQRYSDKRLKTVLNKYDAGLNHILELKPVTFKFKENTGYDEIDTSKTYEGFIAQDLQKVYPKTVQKDEKGYLTIETNTLVNKIILSLINSAKEMNARCEKIKAKNDKLKEDIKLIEKRIKELEK